MIIIWQQMDERGQLASSISLLIEALNPPIPAPALTPVPSHLWPALSHPPPYPSCSSFSGHPKLAPHTFLFPSNSLPPIFGRKKIKVCFIGSPHPKRLKYQNSGCRCARKKKRSHNMPIIVPQYCIPL
ncbi:hypothetical protein GE21DRAFT_1122145 [Neurospora crassa]|nr:hypothetical protein GE21DRAFT_1122145 [Neurospora crassa]